MLTSKKLSQDSPLLGERVVVEMELHSGASFHQVDILIPIVLSTFNQTFVHFQVNQEGHVTEENKESDSGEDETEVGDKV